MTQSYHQPSPEQGMGNELDRMLLEGMTTGQMSHGGSKTPFEANAATLNVIRQRLKDIGEHRANRSSHTDDLARAFASRAGKDLPPLDEGPDAATRGR